MAFGKKILLLVVLLFFVFAFFLSTINIFQKDLNFNTDIARTFLLVENMVDTGHLTLIGPRAGGISGMFFGPAILYLYAPFYILGGGNPIVIAYFWIFLNFFSLYSVFFVSDKIFGRKLAIFASLIYAFFSVPFSSGVTASFGSVLLSPWLLYFMYLFLKSRRLLHITIALLINGFIYQFQPAAGMITLAVTFAITIYIFLREKKYTFFFSYLVLLIPFSTFIVLGLDITF